MDLEDKKGIKLEFSDGRSPLTGLAEINEAMKEVGCGVWPLDLSGVPTEIKGLLAQSAREL